MLFWNLWSTWSSSPWLDHRPQLTAGRRDGRGRALSPWARWRRSSSSAKCCPRAWPSCSRCGWPCGWPRRWRWRSAWSIRCCPPSAWQPALAPPALAEFQPEPYLHVRDLERAVRLSDADAALVEQEHRVLGEHRAALRDPRRGTDAAADAVCLLSTAGDAGRSEGAAAVGRLPAGDRARQRGGGRGHRPGRHLAGAGGSVGRAGRAGDLRPLVDAGPPTCWN